MSKIITISVNTEFARLFGNDVAVIAGVMAANNNQYMTLDEIQSVLWGSTKKMCRTLSQNLHEKLPMGIFEKKLTIIGTKPRVVYRLIDGAYNHIKATMSNNKRGTK